MRKIFIVSFSLFALIYSCISKNINSKQDYNKVFLENDLRKIIEKVEENSNDNTNDFYYHFKYVKFLNQNVTVIDLVKNNVRPILEDGLTNYIKTDNNQYVFTYNEKDTLSNNVLKYLEENKLISKDEISPFFIADTPSWNLYIEKQGNILIVKDMKILLNKSNSNNSDFIDF